MIDPTGAVRVMVATKCYSAERRLTLWLASRLDELMPWSWAAQRSADRLAA